MPKTIGIIGSRRRDSDSDFRQTLAALEEILEEGDVLVSGGCPKGGDRFAEIIAKSKGLTITIHYPNWEMLGKRAGFERNTRIAQQSDVLIAVVAEDRKGGTEDTITKAKRLGKTIILI